MISYEHSLYSISEGKSEKIRGNGVNKDYFLYPERYWNYRINLTQTFLLS